MLSMAWRRDLHFVDLSIFSLKANSMFSIFRHEKNCQKTSEGLFSSLGGTLWPILEVDNLGDDKIILFGK